jgi:phospholipase A1
MLTRLLSLAALAAPLALHAQPNESWQSCAALRNDGERLACFDRWAAGQQPPAAPAAQALPAPAVAAPAVPASVASSGRGLRLTAQEGCRDPRYSELSRQWELETGSDCGTFGVRSLRPLVVAASFADTVNRQPTSENPANNATTAVDYRTREVRLQLSARSKLAQNLLVPASSGRSDSIWFAYSQQSYWQLFTPGISRPFRSTDHEPELMYIYPLRAEALGWRLRYGGLGIVHHSNGQSLPFSRSWNRVYLMAGAETDTVQLRGRIWRRIDEDRINDDNPNISDYYGRAELQASWRPNDAHRLAVTARHSLRRPGRGSLRLEWFRTLWEGADGGGLQLYTGLFTGYGDTLLDYNRRRSVFSVGLSLAEW